MTIFENTALFINFQHISLKNKYCAHNKCLREHNHGIKNQPKMSSPCDT